jgi:RNA polymerase sigma-70 factor (ECF subfamily)
MIVAQPAPGRWQWPKRLAHWADTLWLAVGQQSPMGSAIPAADASAERGRQFDDFFQRYEREVFGYLWRLTGDRQAASDICQETFLRAWQRFDMIRNYEQPVAWLLRVATNLALNDRRARSVRAAHHARLGVSNEPAASDPTWHIAEGDLIHRTLLALPPKMRAALVLREVQGLSFEEVARVLGVTHAAAKMTLSRAREQFRRQYQEDEGKL